MAPRLTSSKAYKIFLDELTQLLTDLERDWSRWPGPVECMELGRRLHMLKGGAGFFGLDALSKAAGELEALFRRTNQDESANAAAIPGLIDDLRLIAAQMPAYEEQT